MNQGRIWCVVHPTVGLPLFLGSVAITSLIVHAEVLSHVSWFGHYWDGAAGRVSMNTETPAAMTKSDAAFTVQVAPVAATTATPSSFVITVTPNAAAPSTVTAANAALAAPPPLRTASNN